MTTARPLLKYGRLISGGCFQKMLCDFSFTFNTSRPFEKMLNAMNFCNQMFNFAHNNVLWHRLATMTRCNSLCAKKTLPIVIDALQSFFRRTNRNSHHSNRWSFELTGQN